MTTKGKLSFPMRKQINWKFLWGCVLILAWTGVIVLFVRTQGDLSLDGLLRYRPAEPFAAVLAMLALFCLKSVDFIMHSGVLYAASGIMFSLPAAMALNILGALIMILVPYAIGKTLGPPIVDRLLARYPRLQILTKIRSENQLVISMVLRLVGLPMFIVGLYLGAMGFRSGRYALGSLIGLLDSIICFTVMGVSAGDRNGPVFWIALACQVGIALLSLLFYLLLRRRKS